MPSSAIVHAAMFTAGALLGGGIAAAVSSRQRPAQDRIPAIIDVDPTGKTKMSPSLVARSDLPPVLKYGHPGTLNFYVNCCSQSDAFCLGPISDVLIRKAYVAGYDRRLRHPSWVCNSLYPIRKMLSCLYLDSGTSNSCFP
jgi:endonuclease G